MIAFLEFEKPVADLESKIESLRQLSGEDDSAITGEIERLQAKSRDLLRDIYRKLNAWQKTQVARHPNRPHFEHYIAALIEDFTPLAGDRTFGDDKAIIGGLGRFRGSPVMVIGHEKGFDTESRLAHNFGMARPEGYRKAARLMRLADRFGLPIITLVDTAGAYPGIGAEERGQAEAIARSTEACLEVGVPLIAVIIGEGGSGGAVALASANHVIMLEHAIYSVISPEGCASILWHTADQASVAAEALKLTAQDVEKLGIIDELVPEPLGGIHRSPDTGMADVGAALVRALDSLKDMSAKELRAHRARKYLELGAVQK